MKNKRSMMESECDVKDIVVIDNGTDTIKVGISGEDQPRLIYENMCGQPTLQNDNDNLNNKQQLLFGSSLKQAIQGTKYNVQLSNPIAAGRVDNFEQMKDFWTHILEEGLQISELTQVNLLVIDQVRNNKDYKAKLAEILFDYLKVQSVLFMNSASLSLFSTGTVSGLSIELGHSLNTVVPIYQGFPIMHALQYSPISGQQITNYLSNFLKEDNIPIEGFGDLERVAITKDIKERMCYIAEDFETQTVAPDTFGKEERSYELPDSQVIEVSPKLRYTCGESLFNPGLFGAEAYSLQDMICDSVNRCDDDLKAELLGNMVLGGGTSMFQGLIPRLYHEVGSRFDGVMDTGLNFAADFQRRYSAWIGGSMMGSLSTFQSLAITRQEYEENPENKITIIHKKTF